MPEKSFMTREQAIERLAECPGCHRWITTPDCDHCWVDKHRCPPTVEGARAIIERAIKIGREAEAINAKLKLVR